MRPLLAFLGCRGVIKRKNKYHLGITLAIYTHGSKYGVWGGYAVFIFQKTVL